MIPLLDRSVPYGDNGRSDSGGDLGVSGNLAWAIDAVARETMLFAAAGFLLGGIDDLAIDLIYFGRAICRRWIPRGARRRPLVADFPALACSGRIAVFIAAWDESAVIGAMLRTALGRFDHPDYRLYVGTYPNDRATIDAVAKVAGRDERVRLVIGARDGPTTKADCLNVLWRALLRDEAIGIM